MKVKVKRKIVAIIMLILVIFNSLPINSFAAFITDINSNAEFGVVSGSLAEYNHELHFLLFCLYLHYLMFLQLNQLQV